VTDGWQDEGSLGRGRSLAAPAFPQDDGTADPQVRAALQGLAAGELDAVTVARRLRDARLLASVVAVLDERDEAGGDKSSHMAVVSMVNADGEKGLLAFTGVDSLAAWNADARPVPSLGRDAARAALDDGAVAIVLDVAGPQAAVLGGAALLALADALDVDALAALVHAALAPITSDGWAEVRILDARDEDLDADVLVVIESPAGGHPDGRRIDALVEQAARILAGRADIQRRVPGGMGVTAGPVR
jgi:hypothetical protein